MKSRLMSPGFEFSVTQLIIKALGARGIAMREETKERNVKRESMIQKQRFLHSGHVWHYLAI